MKLSARLLTAAAILMSPISYADNILVVMSEVSEMKLKEGSTYKTGFYLNELIEPVKILMDAGHDLTFATPTGRAPTLDPVSDTPEHFLDVSQGNYQQHKALFESLNLTDERTSPVISFSRVEQLGIEQFDGLFVPGGHAPIGDLVSNSRLGNFLRYFNETSKPTALVCHGPVALLSALENSREFEQQLKAGRKDVSAGDWVYADYKMTTFSNSEEAVATKYYLGGDELFYWPQDALTKAGGDYSRSEQDWQPHVVVDRELITGQNNKSSVGVANAMIKLLSR